MNYIEKLFCSIFQKFENNNHLIKKIKYKIDIDYLKIKNVNIVNINNIHNFMQDIYIKFSI